MRVRQRACVSDGARQASAQSQARACVTVFQDAAPEEGFAEDEVGDEVRPEWYLSGPSAPQGETRGFRDPLRADDPSPCLTSPSPTLALPAPPGQVPLLLPPPPPVEPPSAMEVSPAERNLKRKAEECGSRPPKRHHVLDENRVPVTDALNQEGSQVAVPLPAPTVRPGDAAEPPSSPPAPSPDTVFQIGSSSRQRPSSQRPGQPPIRKAEWEPRFRREFDEYQRSERAIRWQIWAEWNSGERRRAYMYTTKVALKEEMKVWKRREERERQGSAARGGTQTLSPGGSAESNPDL